MHFLYNVALNIFPSLSFIFLFLLVKCVTYFAILGTMLVVVLNLSALVIVVVEIKFILNWSREKYGVSGNTFSAFEIT